MKLKLGALIFCMMSLARAETLTQQQYDQQIQHHTEVIKQTKAVLDVPGSKADAEQQSQALCDRLNAYEQIAQLSKDNPELELSSIRLVASELYLNQQKASLGNAGMSIAVFCSGKIKQ